MTPVKCGKQQKFAHRIFACKISCRHCYAMLSSSDTV